MDEAIRKRIEEIRKEHGSVKLNLGCFKDIKEGYINLDQAKFNDKIDVVHDLEKVPYPFEDNTFDGVLARCVLEHISENKRKDIYKELHRICKNGAIIYIRVPYKDKIHRCVDHKGGGFNFQYFRNLCSPEQWNLTERYELVKLEGEPTVFARRFVPKFLRVKLSYFLNEIIENVIAEIKVVK